IPTLTWLLIQGLQSNDININFQGIAIGNGILSDRQQFNSLINFNYFHGMFGKSDWDLLRQYCCVNSSTSECDFLGAYYHDPRGPCARQAVHMADRWQEETLSDVYNVYQDCYRLKVSHSATERTLRKIDGRRRWLKKSSSHMSQKFTDNQGQINYASTDQFNAFPCFSDDATQNYLNRADVRAAIHIPATLTKTWTDCTDLRHWQFQYDDMTPVFVNILNSQYYANANFRMLIYNGDVDTVCNFLGDEWFIEALVKSQNISTVAERTDWTYQASADYRSQTGGYVKRFAKNLDQLTVKGSGHFVPQDRPGPALQMLMNFINKSPVYDTLTNIDVTPKPLLPQYAGTAQSPCPRKDADLIVSLPGLTFQPNFKQYSGYLNASANNFLHYWLVESQDNPATDPLILWLNGGPGCSSVGGFMTENGPFHPNQDGATLYENVYSWNKKANVLYLEAPRGVGYSYQTVDNQTWSDDLTAEDNYLALKDFFTNVFPEYATRQFFVTGESYGGVYIPTLAWRLFQGIQSGDISIKFQGVAIGNGVLSERLQLNSVVDFLYYHGIVGKDDWNFLMTNCCANVTDTTDCDFYQYMPTGSDGQPMPQPNPCGMKVLMLGEAYVWGSYNDPYNIYQDCYRTKLTKYAAQRVFPHVRPSKQRFDKWDSKNFVPKQKFADNARQINYGSTDPFNGFPCWSDSATEMYMNRAEVRAALNIPDSVPRWTDCNDHILGAFVRQYLDMSDVMKNIINSPLYEQLQFRILVYNGDVDTVCNFLGTPPLVHPSDEANIANKSFTFRRRMVR
uniref:Carboxypeptidase n=1 Tax=Plectus sambesii TaxID=2011161 RepID=A0A914XFD1_9BILA